MKAMKMKMPPAHQLYKGLPGIHVSVHNPGEEEARALGGGSGLPLETTLVQTHTPDKPFIFESLKNYLQKQGLRVFSASRRTCPAGTSAPPRPPPTSSCRA